MMANVFSAAPVTHAPHFRNPPPSVSLVLSAELTISAPTTLLPLSTPSRDIVPSIPHAPAPASTNCHHCSASACSNFGQRT